MSIPKDFKKRLEALEERSTENDEPAITICQFIESEGKWDPFDPYEWEIRHPGKHCFIVEDCGGDSDEN